MIVIICPCCDSNNINIIIINKDSEKMYFKCIICGTEFGKNQAIYEEK